MTYSTGNDTFKIEIKQRTWLPVILAIAFRHDLGFDAEREVYIRLPECVAAEVEGA